MADENENTEVPEDTEVPVSNIGYADVPDGYVFIPGVTGDAETLQALFAAVDDPEEVIARPGYGYVVPKAAAKKAKLKAEDVVQVIDPSTPDTTPAQHATDTQDDAGVQDNVGDTADGPLPEGATTESVEDDTPAAAPAVNAQAVDPAPAPSDPPADNAQTPVITDAPSGDVPTIPTDAAPADPSTTISSADAAS